MTAAARSTCFRARKSTARVITSATAMSKRFSTMAPTADTAAAKRNAAAYGRQPVGQIRVGRQRDGHRGERREDEHDEAEPGGVVGVALAVAGQRDEPGGQRRVLEGEVAVGLLPGCHGLRVPLVDDDVGDVVLSVPEVGEGDGVDHRHQRDGEAADQDGTHPVARQRARRRRRCAAGLLGAGGVAQRKAHHLLPTKLNGVTMTMARSRLSSAVNAGHVVQQREHQLVEAESDQADQEEAAEVADDAAPVAEGPEPVEEEVARDGDAEGDADGDLIEDAGGAAGGALVEEDQQLEDGEVHQRAGAAHDGELDELPQADGDARQQGGGARPPRRSAAVSGSRSLT